MWLVEGSGELMLGLTDDRPISVIASEWEGIPRMERISQEEGDLTYEGYTRIRRIMQGDPFHPGKTELVLVRDTAY